MGICGETLHSAPSGVCQWAAGYTDIEFHLPFPSAFVPTSLPAAADGDVGAPRVYGSLEMRLLIRLPFLEIY